MNTIEFLQISSAIVPDREALVEVGGNQQRLSYLEMAETVSRLAAIIENSGVAHGDKVAVMSQNSAEYVMTYYACAMLGVTFVPLNYRSKDAEISHMLNISGAKILFSSERYTELVNRIRPSLDSTKVFICYDSAADGFEDFKTLLAAAEPSFNFVEIDDSEPTILMFTSGTTALPKGVILSYLDLTAYVTNTMNPADPDTHDKTLVSVPFFHIAGATAMMSSIWGGRTLLILPQFSPDGWLNAVDKEGATHSMVVPTMLKRIMEDENLNSTDFTSLQLITYGAAPMPYEVVRKACDIFPPQGVGLMNAYGQTESTSTLTFLGPDDHDLSTDKEKREERLRSVGRPMDDVEIGIMDERNKLVADGEEGEICVRSDRVMQGYYDQEDATSSAIISGWLHTGDVGRVDEDGYLFITGRKKDLIIRGGENISPGEIENCLEDHPQIEEAAVIGVPDTEWGEVVKAILVLKPDAKMTQEEVTEYCKSNLASFKAPQYIGIVNELPRNAMGKVLKNDLRKDYGEASNNNV
ncbi:MAG: class I adenylate-forming enzyme family protein [Tepidiformaceae bacterium]